MPGDAHHLKVTRLVYSYDNNDFRFTGTISYRFSAGCKYLLRLNKSRRTSSAMPQIKETILLCVAWSAFLQCSDRSGKARAAPETPVNLSAEYNEMSTMQCYFVRGR